MDENGTQCSIVALTYNEAVQLNTYPTMQQSVVVEQTISQSIMWLETNFTLANKLILNNYLTVQLTVILLFYCYYYKSCVFIFHTSRTLIQLPKLRNL